MKYLLINNLYPPYSRGGAEKIVARLAEGLQARGEVVLITSAPNSTASPARENGVLIYRLNPGNFYYLTDDWQQPALTKLAWHFFDLFNFSLARKVRKIIIKEKPDLILTHNLKGLSLRIFGALKKYPAVCVHTLHDYQLLDPHGSLFRNGSPRNLTNPLYAGYSFFTRLLTNKIQLVVSPSAFVLNKHLEYGFFKQAQTVVLPNPATLLKELVPTKEVFTKVSIGFLGQLAAHKGVNFLINTFKNWDNLQAELIIAGSGEQSQQIIEAVKSDNRIKVLGKIEPEKLAEFFAKIDVLAVPSIWWENSPTVIAEAYAYGVPVLVSDAGGSKELVKEGQTGWVFKSGDSQDLLNKFEAIKANRQNLPALAKNCQAVAAEFSLEKYLDNLLELCRGLKK